ncbi:MAG: thiol:disulfide interchange protein DsbA/DsbL [Porticoccus sp.]
MRKLLSQLLFAIVLAPLVACQAETEAQYKEGVHYEMLPEVVSTSDPARIEVVEVFWYGCSHCYSFESNINPWSRALPDDVSFQRVPAVWHATMGLHAKAYYTAKALKVLDKLHAAMFEAMNLKKQKLENQEEIAKIFVENGVSLERFTKVFNSKGIEMAVDLAMKKQARYRTQGTPEVIVNGKYRVSGRSAGGNDAMLKVADFLIQKERALAQ